MSTPRPLRKIAIVLFTLALSLGCAGLAAAEGPHPPPPPPPTSNIHDASFASSTPGWAVADDGHGNAQILIQVSGNWQVSNTFNHQVLNSIVMISANEGYAVGNGGIIYSYDGHKWGPAKGHATNQSLHRVKADASGIIFSVGDNGTAVVGSSGGQLDDEGWIALPPAPGNPNLYGGAMVSDGNGGYIGYAVGAGGAIVEFASATNSWTPISSPTTADLSDVNLTDLNDGFATTFSGQVLTLAGGSWTLNTTLDMSNNGVLDLSGGGERMNGSRNKNPGRFDLTGVTAIVVGNSGGTGMIGLDRGGTWSTTNPVSQGVQLNYLTVDASGNIYAVGSGSTIIPIQ